MSYFLAPYNTSTVIRFPLVKRSVVDLAVKADYTPAQGDSTISKDGGASANTSNNLNIVTGTTWNVTLSAAELSCKEAVIMVRNNSAVEDQWVKVLTYGNASAFFQGDITAPNIAADLRQIVGAAVSGPATAGVLDVNVKNVNNVAAPTNLPVDLRQIVGAAVSGPQTAGILDVNVKNLNNAAFNANQAQVGAAVITIANNAITAASINANAITGAKVFNDVDIRNVNGNVGSVTNNIGGSVAGSVGSVTGNVGNVTGNIGGSVAGSVGSVAGNVAAVTGNIGGNVAGSVGSVINLNAQLVDAKVSSRATAADVLTQVRGALTSDAQAEPGQAAPAANADLATKVSYLFKLARNKITQNSTQLSVYNDDTSTVDQKATVSDDGTTYTRGELGSGP